MYISTDFITELSIGKLRAMADSAEGKQTVTVLHIAFPMILWLLQGRYVNWLVMKKTEQK